MIEITRRESEHLRLAYEDPRRFDAVIAKGYFDYLEQPLPHHEKLITASRDHGFASFPKRWTRRTAPRKAHFLLAGGFVRFYDRRENLDLFRRSGRLESLSLFDLGRDFVALHDAGSAAVLAGGRR